MDILPPYNAVGRSVGPVKFFGVAAVWVSGRSPAAHGLFRLSWGKGELSLLCQRQQTGKPVRQRIPAIVGGLPGGEGRQMKQGFDAQRAALQVLQMDPVVIAVQRLDRRTGRRKERNAGFPTGRLQPLRLFRRKMLAAKGALAQGLQQVLRTELRVAGTLAQQKFGCMVHFCHQISSHIPPSVKRGVVGKCRLRRKVLIERTAAVPGFSLRKCAPSAAKCSEPVFPFEPKNQPRADEVERVPGEKQRPEIPERSLFIQRTASHRGIQRGFEFFHVHILFACHLFASKTEFSRQILSPFSGKSRAFDRDIFTSRLFA
ncbi:hypothetical protein SDC9_147754 [bioreactor metagenome]|uniref:Uncharacterized protein n=1 Tax=bioreactor metagenome TaxID=1076179 RepID=A0A645EEX1_9ZZZZ